MRKLLTILFFLPLGVWLCYVAFFAAAAASVVAQVPDPARGAYQAWLSDVPQELYTEHEGAPGAPYAGGGVPKDGYVGPEGAACLLPPRYGYLTDTFGSPRGGGYVHSGIDYGCYGRRDLPVRTPFGGKVVFAGWSLVGYGNLVVIENRGVQVYLAHHDVLTVVPGQIVMPGEVVGLCGSTGNSTGPHVHFEVRVWNERTERWVPVDPHVVWPDCPWYRLAEELP